MPTLRPVHIGTVFISSEPTPDGVDESLTLLTKIVVALEYASRSEFLS
jgi:hypothetical protein